METKDLCWLENAVFPSALWGLCKCHPSAPREDTCTTHILKRSQGRDEGKLLEGKEVELTLGNNFLLPMLSEQSFSGSDSLAGAANPGWSRTGDKQGAASPGSGHWGSDGSSQPLPSHLGRAPASAEPSPGLQAEFRAGAGAPEVSGDPAWPWGAGAAAPGTSHPSSALPSSGAGARLRKAACRAREQLCTRSSLWGSLRAAPASREGQQMMF